LRESASIAFLTTARDHQLDRSGQFGLFGEAGKMILEVILQSRGTAEIGGIRGYIDRNEFDGCVEAGSEFGSTFQDFSRYFGTGKYYGHVESSDVLLRYRTLGPLRFETHLTIAVHLLLPPSS